MAGRFLTKRGGTWIYVRRVPEIYAELDKRVLVRISTKVAVADDPAGRRAARIASRLNAETETYWETLHAGRADEARQRYEEARRRARAMGFDYVDMLSLVAQKSADDLMQRIEALAKGSRADDPSAVAGVLGAEERPALTLATLFTEYESLEKASLAGMSENQARKWGNPKKRAVANLVGVVGDKRLDEVTRGDALKFREWWQDRVLTEGLDVDTANKDFGHINRMVRTIDRRYHLGLPPLFADMRLNGAEENQRAAFAAQFVQDKIFAAGALAGLNSEARAVIYIVAETGLRLSEATNLTRSTIRLDAAVPHVQVRPDGRRMKTPHSARDIPLVGVALVVAKAFPDGFPRYRDKAASLSALINKYFSTHNLRPTDEHSAYSLRHTFEDRLTAVEAPEKVVASLMGHKWIRPKYGAGPSLEQKQQWLKRIAFKPPAVI